MVMYRLLIVNESYVGGGAEVVFNDTIKALRTLEDKNIKIYTATTDNLDKEDHLTLDNSRNGLFSPIKYVFNFTNYKRFLNFLIHKKIDIIHIHNFYSFISPSILLAIKKYKKINEKAKVIQTLHDYSLICPNSSLYNYGKDEICEKCVGKKNKLDILKNRCYFGKLSISLLKFVRTNIALNILKHHEVIDIFISPSEFLKKKLIEDGLINPQKIKVVPNPLSDYFFEYTNSNTNSYQKINQVVFLGRLSYEKGIHLLIRAWMEIERDVDNWHLLIIGDGDLRNYLKDLSKNTHSIKFIGKKQPNEVVNILLQSKFLVLPSTCYENQPKVVLEAIACRCIPIVSSIGGMRELADKFRTPVMFESGNIESLKAILKHLLKNDFYEKTNFLFDYDINILKEEFSYDAYANKLREIYFY